MSKNSTSFDNYEASKGDISPEYRLFVARVFEPQKLPIAFLSLVIFMWIAIIVTVCGLCIMTTNWR